MLITELKDFHEPYNLDGQRRFWSRIWNYVPKGVNDYTWYVSGHPASKIAIDPLCEVGCPYAVRGFDNDYVGILWLNDFLWNGKRWVDSGSEDTDAWQNLLLNTEFLIEEEDRKPATVAGLLLFCANPNRFLPQAGIDAVAYPGKEKDYAAKERLAIRGPMTALMGNGGIIENGLVEQAVEFVRRNTQVTAALADGSRREQTWTYPEEAVRETIVNALVHRDYLLSGTTVELSIYEDRLEVISPGRLPNGITPKRMVTGCRSARNQLLKDVMRDYGYLEHMGMGVPRKIVKGMQEHNGTTPELIEDEELFTVRLWNK